MIFRYVLRITELLGNRNIMLWHLIWSALQEFTGMVLALNGGQYLEIMTPFSKTGQGGVAYVRRSNEHLIVLKLRFM